MAAFAQTLRRHNLELVRNETTVLQVNVGRLCNQACRHCHHEAGPERTEVMDRRTVEEVIAYAGRGGFAAADITGGAPELNPHVCRLVDGLAQAAPRVMFRANLTALLRHAPAGLWELLAAHRVEVMASLPSPNPAQAEAQRGAGTFADSLEALRRLNALGYGQPGSGLALNLVANPGGSYLPPDQAGSERRFREVLARKWGLAFNHLLMFANAPLGRFKRWLRGRGDYEGYLDKLEAGFNPCAVQGVMCRTLVSVAWDGLLYDCDFNLAAGLPLGGRRVHVAQMPGPPPPGQPIAVGEHCYSCTAGSGFT